MEACNEADVAVDPGHTLEPQFPMLPFEKQIFIDMQERDALLVMAKYVKY